MPELPEAEVVARHIRSRLSGAVLTDVWLGRDDIVREGIKTLPWFRGARLSTVDRYGKSVAMGFVQKGETRFVVAELGMTGLLLFRSVEAKHPQHVHVRMSFSGADEPELCYWNPRRFGRLSLLDREGLERYISRRFGLDPLKASWEEYRSFVMKCRGRIKALLMHQQSIAGIGNIYANEILFRAGLHPDARASRLSVHAVKQLYDLSQEILHEAIACGGSSVRDFFAPDGTEGTYKQRHLVYGKEGVPCPNLCGQRIKRLRRERSSFICPFCQTKRRRTNADQRVIL